MNVSSIGLTSSYFFVPYYWSRWGLSTVWLPLFFKISSFLFSRRKKFMQVWNNLRVSIKQNFHLLTFTNTILHFKVISQS